MSLVKSIINGDRAPMGTRAQQAVEVINASSNLRARIIDREQDVIEVWVEGDARDAWVRAQVLFDNPNENERIGNRPTAPIVTGLMTLLHDARIPSCEARGMINVVEIDGPTGRLLLDPYIAFIGGVHL